MDINDLNLKDHHSPSVKLDIAKLRQKDLCDVEAHDEVEREDVFIAANVDTPILK